MSLYRKYRPQTFEDVVGQEHVARTLRNALTATPPRVAHAYLFTGPRGIGKTTNARLLAKCLNCQEGPTPVPCNKCSFCTRVAANQSVMDLIEIDAASNTQVDKVRETIIDKVNVSPAEGRYRIYIIDEVHMLSNSSFNALLKTLEEPPPHAVFVLATTEYHKVPPTITSRCQRFDFRRVGPADIVKRLLYVAQSEGFVLHEEAAKLIARHAEGALRDALTLLEQVSAFAPEEISAADVRLVLGGVPQEIIHTLVDCMANGDAHGVLATTEAALEEGASFSQLARDLTAYLRDLMLLTVGFPGDPNLPANEVQLRGTHAQSLGRQRLEAILGMLREAAKEMRENVDHRLILELALVRSTEPNFGLPQLPQGGQANLRPPAVPQRPALRAVNPGVLPPPANPVEAGTNASSAPPLAPAAPTEGAQPQVVPPLDANPAPDDLAPPAATGESPAEPVHDGPDAQQNPNSPAGNIEPLDAVTEALGVEEPAVAAPKKKGRRIRNFEELMELWPAVVVRVRKRLGVTAVAFFHDAYPAAFTDEEVVLEFKKEFHFAKTAEAAQRLPLEQIINETFDKPRRLKFRLAAPAPKAAVVEEIEPDTSGQEDEDLITDGEKISDYAQTLFAAEIMGRSGL